MTLTELYKGCRSYRRFLQQPVPVEVLKAALDNARTASSAANAQPLRYIAITDPALVAAIQPLVKWAGYLPPEVGTPKADQCPTAFVAVIKTAGASAWADIDVGLSVHAMISTAWEAGVGSCMLGAIDAPAIKALLPIAEEETLRLMVAMGYPAHQSHLVPVTDGIKYSLDENGDYLVPKRDFDNVVTFL